MHAGMGGYSNTPIIEHDLRHFVFTGVVSLYVYIHTYTHVFVCIYIHIHMFYVCIYIYLHMPSGVIYMYMHIYVHVCISFMYMICICRCILNDLGKLDLTDSASLFLTHTHIQTVCITVSCGFRRRRAT